MSSRAEIEIFYGRRCFLEASGAIQWGPGWLCSGLLDEGIYRISGAKNNLVQICLSKLPERKGR